MRMTLFPLGDFTKKEIIEHAKKLGLSSAKRAESQEICFIPNNDYVDYIKNNSQKSLKPGDFLDTNGNFLGKHTGIINYTIGQRKGLGVTFGKPVYVVKIDAKNNTIVLGEEKDLLSKELFAEKINYILINKPENPIEIQCKIRSTAKPCDALLIPLKDDKIKINFNIPQRAVTPGQSVVFYNNDIVLGGGVISK